MKRSRALLRGSRRATQFDCCALLILRGRLSRAVPDFFHVGATEGIDSTGAAVRTALLVYNNRKPLALKTLEKLPWPARIFAS